MLHTPNDPIHLLILYTQWPWHVHPTIPCIHPKIPPIFSVKAAVMWGGEYTQFTCLYQYKVQWEGSTKAEVRVIIVTTWTYWCNVSRALHPYVIVLWSPEGLSHYGTMLIRTVCTNSTEKCSCKLAETGKVEDLECWEILFWLLFSAVLKNMSLIPWPPFSWWVKPEYLLHWWNAHDLLGTSSVWP